jgi:uncharacterized protein (TIGR02300 family)
MTKPKQGTKRLCAHCGTRFYDLLRTPITCPRCETACELASVTSRFKAAPEAERVQPFVDPELSSTDAAAGDGLTPGDLADVEDDVELNGAAIIDEGEQDDGDLDEIAGGDEDAEEEGSFPEAGISSVVLGRRTKPCLT